MERPLSPRWLACAYSATCLCPAQTLGASNAIHMRDFSGDQARQIARSGKVSGKGVRYMPWWPEETCEKIDKVIWRIYLLGDMGEDWHEFTAYDDHGKVLAVHRTDGY